MNTREIRFGSDGYQDCLALRTAVLRTPLGMQLSAEDVADEQDQYHVGIFQNNRLVGCIVAKTIEEGRLAKIRQMAISPEVQGKGFGRRLIRDAESLLRVKGIRELELHAREDAVPFYEKQGYQSVGDFFERLGIPHLKMQKHL